MPKTPILSRTLLFSRLRDKTIRFLHWNRVQTSLGVMWESRDVNEIPRSGTTGNAVVQEDVYNSAYTDINEVSDGSVFQGLHGGIQVPGDFNTQ